jgi:pSer/pThr/pTyr-binding forkhead associated (FHA) protein
MNDNRRLAGIVFTFSRRKNGEFWPVYEGSNKIGRSTDNAICLSHESVSPAHASIFAIESVGNQQLDFRVMDIGSETGTFVDDAQLFAGDRAFLSMKSCIKIGRFELIFIPIDGVKEAYATHPALESADLPPHDSPDDSSNNSIAKLLKTISSAAKSDSVIDPRGTTI